jgi:NADH-quinone oxidoreductase subunit L
VFGGGARALGTGLWKGGDQRGIDGIVNGSARVVGWFANVTRLLQSGYIYHYAFAMILGVVALMTIFVTLGSK